MGEWRWWSCYSLDKACAVVNSGIRQLDGRRDTCTFFCVGLTLFGMTANAPQSLYLFPCNRTVHEICQSFAAGAFRSTDLQAKALLDVRSVYLCCLASLGAVLARVAARRID